MRRQFTFSVRVFFINIVSILTVFLLMYAAMNKLIEHDKFRTQIGQSPLLTDFKGFIVWVVPLIELGIVFLFFSEERRLLALYLSWGLMVIFSAYIFCITRFTENIPCSCGGILDKISWELHLKFNLCFVIIIMIAIFLDRPKA
ncbi:hypothetical protein FFJ24_021415 [Pedobacter sp. KBS0701]|uniref:MauE/DoxX family redox-associated membrane protein n=1 Tax=Pedobacter sp. KBS0701 TaxID=2578106 RepID=UPI00110F4E38|nr:MauE/DoxX family redox-associated membrane protein [Pedobacter sp. KBS0701]QDW27247.1 hypothetical protein FFJ24_021415 [Pedobacter sp. KBS0701]